MDNRRGLVALTFMLSLLWPVALPGALAAGPGQQAPRADCPSLAQRGEDPLQAPRGETR